MRINNGQYLTKFYNMASEIKESKPKGTMFSDQRQQEETPNLRKLSTCHQASFAHAEDLRLCRTEYSNYTYLHLKGNGSLTSRRPRNVSLRACLLDCCNLALLTFRGVCDEVILVFVDPGRFRFQRQS